MPATSPVFFFEELSESLPTCVAYEHLDNLWWNLGYFHDLMHGALENVEPYNKFTQNVWNRMKDDDVIGHLGACMYMKPGADRPVIYYSVIYII